MHLKKDGNVRSFAPDPHLRGCNGHIRDPNTPGLNLAEMCAPLHKTSGDSVGLASSSS